MDLGLLVVWCLIVVVLLFGLVVLFGAPYLPTLQPQTKAALDMLDLKEGQTLLELGSGDGRVMMAAAERGWRVVGYELNPLLVLYSWIRTRRYKGRVRVVWGNFWWQKLPQADGVFVFLLSRYMQKLDKKITQDIVGPVKLASVAFRVPGRKPIAERDGVFLYSYKK